LTENFTNTDTALIAALANDSEQAFAALYNKYHPKLFYFVLNFTQSQQVAEDALQEVFVKIWQERKKLGHITNFNAWIFRVAKNHIINHLKRMAHESLILTTIAQEINPNAEDAYAILSYKDIHAVLKAGMNELPPQQKLVMELSREQGLKYEEIASRLNISPLTVKKHAAQALQYLREKIKKHYALSTLLYPLVTLLGNFF
jgi:RNA polymerase sigma-70 factor (ECF subfamily)